MGYLREKGRSTCKKKEEKKGTETEEGISWGRLILGTVGQGLIINR